jgi:hypothetical protein
MKQLNLLYLILLISNCALTAQTVTKSDLKGTKWFSENENQKFYNNDTICLIKIVKFNSYNDSINELNIKLQYIGHKDITNLELFKSGRLKVNNLYVNSWSESTRVGKWKWKFEEINQQLIFYFHRRIDATFKVVSTKTDTTIWEFVNDNDNKTQSKLNLILLQLVRIKKN